MGWLWVLPRYQFFFCEICLQHLEHTKIISLVINQQIICYFRYVGDILMIRNKDLTNIQDVQYDFNNIRPNLNFSLEEEKNNQCNFFGCNFLRIG
jgi:hypothetical protein